MARISVAEFERLAKNGNRSAQRALKELALPKGAGNTSAQYSLCSTLAGQLKTLRVPEFVWDGSESGEFQFHPRRKWRLDFYFPGYELAVEVEGGVSSHRMGKAIGADGQEYYKQSRHLTAKGFEEDAIKYFEAAKAGITVIRVTSKMVSDHRAISMIIQLLEARGWTPVECQLLDGYRQVVNN